MNDTFPYLAVTALLASFGVIFLTTGAVSWLGVFSALAAAYALVRSAVNEMWDE